MESFITNRKKEYNKQYYQRIKDKIVRDRLEKSPEELEASLRYQQIATLKARAKRSGIEFNITEHDIEWPDYCPILGMKLERGRDNPHSSPSIDRVSSLQGYVKGNVRVISNLANTMKSNASVGQLNLFCNNIMKYMKGEL